MTDDQIIRAALAILESRIISTEGNVRRPEDVRDYVAIKLAGRRHEVFALVLLDTRHNVIEYRELFTGTIDGAAVYPREVVRTVLDANAAAVVLVHNHPSNDPEPSEADRAITRKLAKAMEMIDVRLLDHIVCGAHRTVSFAERGLL